MKVSQGFTCKHFIPHLQTKERCMILYDLNISYGSPCCQQKEAKGCQYCNLGMRDPRSTYKIKQEVYNESRLKTGSPFIQMSRWFTHCYVIQGLGRAQAIILKPCIEAMTSYIYIYYIHWKNGENAVVLWKLIFGGKRKMLSELQHLNGKMFQTRTHTHTNSYNMLSASLNLWEYVLITVPTTA